MYVAFRDIVRDLSLSLDVGRRFVAWEPHGRIPFLLATSKEIIELIVSRRVATVPCTHKRSFPVGDNNRFLFLGYFCAPTKTPGHFVIPIKSGIGVPWPLNPLLRPT